MQYRILGKTGFRVSEISLGAWQVGGGWNDHFDPEAASRILNRAMDAGVNFIDTADVYGDGQSEIAVGKAVRARKDRVFVATKCGRRLPAQTVAGYSRQNIFRFAEDSLRRMGLDTLDLLQLHCPPPDIYGHPEVFGALDDLQRAGKIRYYGVSVETVSEALAAMEYPGVSTLQIIFNMFRVRPADEVFPTALKKNVGILARVPLASGLLSGKMRSDTVFASDDHRHYNREGQRFDKGETFSGVDYAGGLRAAEELKALFPGQPLAGQALRWILMHEAVSCAIPGASRPEQAEDNVRASALPPLTDAQMQGVRAVYDKYIRAGVHAQW